jgi:L-lactate utilization protein LutC
MRTELYAQFKKKIELIPGECRRVKDEREIAPALRQSFQEMNVEESAVYGSAMSHRISGELLKLNAGLKLIEPIKTEYSERRKELAGTPAALVAADYGFSDTAGLVIFLMGNGSSRIFISWKSYAADADRIDVRS